MDPVLKHAKNKWSGAMFFPEETNIDLHDFGKRLA